MKTGLVYSENIKKYDFGKGHSFRGVRFEKFMDFFQEKFERFKDQFEIIEPEKARDKEIGLVHDKKYLEAMKSASRGEKVNVYEYLSGDNLNPLTLKVPPGIEEGARWSVGTSITAGELVMEGKFKKAIGIGGGLHHAKPSYGEGFCVYNDVAICTENLKQKYDIEKILILDTDAHAGNGVKEIFYSDPSVLFIDVHQDPKTIYPSTGFVSEIGEREGEGFTVNLPLSPNTGGKAYHYIFEELISPLAEEFEPEVIMRYGGSDPYYLDDLTSLGLTLDGFRMIGEEVRELSDLSEGKEIDLLASGYNLDILPPVWSSLIAGLLDLDISFDIKEENLPSENSEFETTKRRVKELSCKLEKYWKGLK